VKEPHGGDEAQRSCARSGRSNLGNGAENIHRAGQTRLGGNAPDATSAR
jgi:hypothetical protein